MKTVELGEAHLESCVAEAHDDRVLLTRGGKAAALLIGLGEEQDQLGRSQRFWKLIADRRRQPTISRSELESERKRRDLSDLAGSWEEDPETDAVLEEQRRIDPEDWK